MTQSKYPADSLPQTSTKEPITFYPISFAEGINEANTKKFIDSLSEEIDEDGTSPKSLFIEQIQNLADLSHLNYRSNVGSNEMFVVGLKTLISRMDSAIKDKNLPYFKLNYGLYVERSSHSMTSSR
jgi:hypothetical protein